MAGDPLTVATSAVFAGPTGLVASPARLASELPALSSGVGARKVTITPGPVGFASGDLGDLRVAVVGAYAGQVTRLAEADPGTEPGVVDRTTDGSGERHAEVGVALVSMRAAHTFVGLSGRAGARWQFAPLGTFGYSGPSSAAATSDERGRVDGLDFESNVDGNVAHLGQSGGWLLGLSVSWLRSAGWIESKVGEFGEAGEFVYGTTYTGYDDAGTLGYENRTGVWPGFRASIDRGADPLTFDWRVEVQGRGGRLVPTQATHTVTEYGFGSRTELQTSLVEPRGGAVEASLSIWRGFAPADARIRVGAVASTWIERRTHLERLSGEVPPPESTLLGPSPPAPTLGDKTVDTAISRASLAVPVAVDAPLSGRTRFAAALTPGFRFTRHDETASDGSASQHDAELPWLQADAGLSWRAAGRMWVHGLLASEPASTAYLSGYAATANFPGGRGVLPLDVSLWITTEGDR